MPTNLGCKSDCYFAQNEKRECTLKDVQLIQEEKFTPKLVCAQYVPTQVSQQRFNLVDIDKSIEKAIKGKIGV